jgi:hypothetical protein
MNMGRIQGVIVGLLEFGRCSEMEINLGGGGGTKIISVQPSQVQIKLDQYQMGNLEYFSSSGSMITNDARCTRDIKSWIAMANTAFNEKTTLFASKLDLNLRKKLVKCYICSVAFYVTETWTLREVDQIYVLQKF